MNKDLDDCTHTANEFKANKETLSDKIVDYRFHLYPHGIHEGNVIHSKDVKEKMQELEEVLFEWVGGIDKNIEDCDSIRSILLKILGNKLI